VLRGGEERSLSAGRPHRVIIRTTKEHLEQIRKLAEVRSSNLSTTLRDLLCSGLAEWRKSVTGDLPYHGINIDVRRDAMLQLRMPDDLFQELEDIVDDFEYSRTDLYLRMMELGRECFDVENDAHT
jgi:hypothetical protein